MIPMKRYEVITMDGQVAFSRIYTENCIPRSKSRTRAETHAETQVYICIRLQLHLRSSTLSNSQSTFHLQILCRILFSVRSTVLLV